MHDLEIRGTGEVLGESQSGNIQEVGFYMYTDMLNEAVRALKAGEEPDLDAPFDKACEVNLHAPALLPADYCAGRRPDIAADQVRRRTRGPYGGRGLLGSLVVVRVVDEDVGARLGERQADGPADALGATGDEDVHDCLMRGSR